MARTVTAVAGTRRRPNTATKPFHRDRHGLLARLELVDALGWDSEPGCELLTYVRHTVVRPQLAKYRLGGTLAAQAEASAWAVTWRTLCSPRLRQAASPWGILWAAAGRAIADETMAAAYGTGARKAWQQRAEQRQHQRDGAAAPDPGSVMVSLEVLLDHGFEPDPAPAPADAAAADAPLLRTAVALLVEVGWDADRLCAALLVLAERSTHKDGHPYINGGWRALALQTGIPGWQARRLAHVLLGTSTSPGLLEQLARGSSANDLSHHVMAALRSTVDPKLPSPDALARKASLRTAS